MGTDAKILVMGKSLRGVVASALCVCLALSACGQKGNLYLPKDDPDFQDRAKLPDIIRRHLPGGATTPPAAATPASAPAPAASAAGR